MNVWLQGVWLAKVWLAGVWKGLTDTQSTTITTGATRVYKLFPDALPVPIVESSAMAQVGNIRILLSDGTAMVGVRKPANDTAILPRTLNTLVRRVNTFVAIKKRQTNRSAMAVYGTIPIRGRGISYSAPAVSDAVLVPLAETHVSVSELRVC